MYRINGIDKNTLPSIPIFDKSKYQFLSFKQILQCNINDMSEDDMKFELFFKFLQYYMNIYIYIFFIQAILVNIPTKISTVSITSKLQNIMIHIRKKSLFKANIQIIKGMSFKDLIFLHFLIIYQMVKDLLQNLHLN